MSKRFMSTIVICAAILTVGNTLALATQRVGAINLPVSAIPQMINYQGRLSDVTGNVLTGVYSMTFNLYDQAANGRSLWNETQQVNVTNGLFNALLGSNVTIPADAFQNPALYLGVRIGSDMEMMPRRQVMSGG